MEKESIILTKSFDFGVRIFNLYKWLVEKHRVYSVADQILRSGTSIGANIEEAAGGFSKKEFAVKIGIAYKEARERQDIGCGFCMLVAVLKRSSFNPCFQIVKC